MSKKGGSKSVVHSCLRPFSTKYFWPICLWNMVWQMPIIRTFEINHFWTEYFRRVYHWNINGQAIGFETFEINHFWTEYFRLKKENSEGIRFYERGEFRINTHDTQPASQTWHIYNRTTLYLYKRFHHTVYRHKPNTRFIPSKNLRTLLSQDLPKKHPLFSRIF